MRIISATVAFFALLSQMPSYGFAASAETGAAPTPADYEQVRDGYFAYDAGRCDDVMALLLPMADDSSFAGFPEFVRRGALERIVDCAMDLRRLDVAVPYAYKLIDIPNERTPYYLRMMLWIGGRTDNPGLAVDALRRLADIDAREISRINYSTLAYVYRDIQRQNHGEDLRYTFQRILYDTQYAPANPFHSADEFMVDYARMAADRGDTDGLKGLVQNLTDPGYIMQIRIDRRFDVVRQDGSLEGFLDLDAAAERDIARLEALVNKHPDMLIGFIKYSRALVAAKRYDEALEAIEPVALRVREPGGREDFSDADSMENWALEEYAKVLSKVRYAEQSDAMHWESSELPEDTRQNVSQRINYLGSQFNVGNFDRVRTVLKELENGKISEYGWMLVHHFHVCVEAMSDSGREYAESMAYLVEHERDNPKALIDTYLCLDDLSSAADVLIRQLQRPDQRISALVSLQYSTAERTYYDNIKPDLETHGLHGDQSTGHMIDYRFNSLRSRSDVREAANAVGYIEEISLDESAWYSK